MSEKNSKSENKKKTSKNEVDKNTENEKSVQNETPIDNKDLNGESSTGEIENKENEENSNEIDRLNDEITGLKDKYMRCAAEYANFRSRTEKEKLEIYTNATIDAIKNILPIADSIELALASCENAGDEYKKGLELIKSQIDKAFESLNVESFGEKGEKFDPSIHNAISKTEDESFGENEISMVFQKGYKCKDKIIRYCMVQVAN